MAKLHFTSNASPTIGVEIELALVDVQSTALTSAAPIIIERTPQELAGSVKPELMQCYIEINTGVCNSVDEARRDLAEKLRAVETIADQLGVGLLWSGTHPFSTWEEQSATEDERYARLLDLLQDMGRQLVTFGLHVHVGVESGDKAVMICDRIMRHLPLLVALSCNSPWWNGRVSGLQSHRLKIMEGLPTAGLPPLMRNWSEYVWLVNHLEETGFINSIRDIWWFVRPHHNFGTVEVRVCDMPGKLEDVAAITALIHALVCGLSDDIEEGAYQHDSHPMLVRQNMWQAERFGLDAMLIDSTTYEPRPVREMIRELVDLLIERPAPAGVREGLERVRRWTTEPTWAQRQMEFYRETGSVQDTIRRMLRESRLSET